MRRSEVKTGKGKTSGMMGTFFKLANNLKHIKAKMVLFFAGILLLSTQCPGCGNTENGSGNQNGISNGENTMSETDTSTESASTEFQRELVTSAEAEDGEMLGKAKVESSVSGYSGSGYVDGLAADGDGVKISFSVEKEGFYDLDFTCATSGGYKENYVFVDGESIGNLTGDTKDFGKVTIPHVYLTAGKHEVKVEKYWGYALVDRLDVMTAAPFDTSLYDVKVGLSDAKASTNAKKIYQYLKDNYGKNIISGQYCDEGIFGHEMAVIWKATKKFPAMVGLDMIEYSPSRVANGSQGKSIDHAIQAWEEGSLVTMCWHWNAPKDYLTGQWYSGFYKEHTNINLDKIMSGQDQKGYDLLISDMDAIAKELTKLRDKDVPVLWRPLHEASGGWFWWGNCSADSYKKLYRLMYQKFTEEYELHNLIWVWNGQSADWFPGEDVVDILGIDIYPGEHVYTSQYPKYIETAKCSAETRIVTLSENGCLVDPDLALRDGAMWSYFGTWGGEFVTESKTLNAYSEKYTDEEMLIKVYNHEKVITRDELPDFSTYPVGE